MVTGCIRSSTKYYSVGISIGAAPGSAVRDMDSLFRLADSACYAAKNAGRNQVHVVDARMGLVDTQAIRKLFIEDEIKAGSISVMERGWADGRKD